MGLHLPVLETDRLLIRPFTMADLGEIYRIFDQEAWIEPQPLDERRAWLEWTVRNYIELEKLEQPPYGDRAVVLKEDNRLIGSVGLVPLIGPFGLLAALGGPGLDSGPAGSTTEMGLFWALETASRGHGYASEAARALVDYAFRELDIARLAATTGHDNLTSRRVMERLGMRIETNPDPEQAWFQVVGILENPSYK